MRSIDEIISELRDHPDYIESIIWDRQRVLDYLTVEIKWSDGVMDEIDESWVHLTEDMISEKEWEQIYINVEHALDDMNHESDINIDVYKLDLYKKVIRDIKINQIINK